MTPDDCEDCCSAICCSTVGYVCCCRKMNKTTKIKILWAWLIILASTSGVILYCGVYSPIDRLATPSDMIAVSDHVNFLFCEELKIKSPGLQFNAYLVLGDLEVDSQATKRTIQTTAMFVSARNYDYFAFYFLKDSSLTLQHCSKKFMTVYVIIGNSNFEDWKNDQYCGDCYFTRHYVPSKSNCSPNQYSTFTIDILVEEEYFIVYSNDNYEDAWVDLHIDMDRRVYDLRNATPICTETTECDLFLEAPNQTPLFWVMDYYNLGEHNHPLASTKCIPRIWAFLVIHGFPVLLIGILATFIIQRTHRRANELNRVTERTPLLIDASLPPSYSTVMLDPPKYEDISRLCEPPSYTEVIADLQSSPAQTLTERNSDISAPVPNLTEQNSENSFDVNAINSNETVARCEISSVNESLSNVNTVINRSIERDINTQELSGTNTYHEHGAHSGRISINFTLYSDSE